MPRSTVAIRWPESATTSGHDGSALTAALDTGVFWGSDTSSAEWDIVREGDAPRVRADWHSTVGGHESLLAERGDVVVPARDFIAEWVKVLRRIVTDIGAERVESEEDYLLRRAKALLAS